MKTTQVTSKATYMREKGILRHGRYTRMEKRNFLFIYLMLAFPVLQFIVFWGYVDSSMIAMSFQDSYGNWSMQSFKDVFAAIGGADRWGFNLLEMTWRSVQLFLIQNVLCFGCNILLSYILTKKIAGHKIFRTCYMLPSIVGTVVFSSIMKSLYAYDGALIAIGKMFGIKFDIMTLRNGLLGSAGTAFTTMKWQTLIFNMTGANIILTGAYMRIPADVYDAAKIDGVGFFREIFKIAVPFVWPTISMLILYASCSLLTTDYGTYLYTNGTGNPEMSTIGFYLYFLQVKIAETTRGTLYYSYASAFGLLITALTVPVVLLVQYILGKIHETVEY